MSTRVRTVNLFISPTRFPVFPIDSTMRETCTCMKNMARRSQISRSKTRGNGPFSILQWDNDGARERTLCTTTEKRFPCTREGVTVIGTYGLMHIYRAAGASPSAPQYVQHIILCRSPASVSVESVGADAYDSPYSSSAVTAQGCAKPVQISATHISFDYDYN